MRLGIDARELLGQRTGVGRYLAELCREWVSTIRTHELVLYTPEAGDDPSLVGPPFTDASSGPFRHRSVPGRSGTWWEQMDLPAAIHEDNLDLFFSPAYSTPLRLGIPAVVTMHDVSFIAHPEWFSWREGLRRRWLARQATRRAVGIISVSGFSRDEILRFYDVPTERVHVVRSGIAPCVDPPSSNDGREPLVLYVGSIFNRRHLPTLIRAFALVRDAVVGAKLAVVGDDRTYPPEDLPGILRATGTTHDVTFLSYVSEPDLTTLYRRARVFAFLSEYEGFGFPPLEAMSAGLSVVVADTPVARELYDDAARFVPLRNVRATAEALITLLVDPAARADQRERADRVLPRFTWERAARETMDVLETASALPSRS